MDQKGGDANGIRPCLFTTMYSKYLRYVPPENPINVLDLGANVGAFSLLLASKGYSFNKLVNVEMNPLTAIRLRLNLSHNIYPIPIVINAAVFGEIIKFTRAQTRGGTGESIFQTEASNQTNQIQTVLLDDLVKENFGDEEIDICKMDVEGAEYDIFRSTTCGRINQCKNLLIEIHTVQRKDPGIDEKPDALIEHIEKLGFKEVLSPDSSDANVHFFQRI
jgi:FkbM family methyltransferase